MQGHVGRLDTWRRLPNIESIAVIRKVNGQAGAVEKLQPMQGAGLS